MSGTNLLSLPMSTLPVKLCTSKKHSWQSVAEADGNKARTSMAEILTGTATHSRANMDEDHASDN